MKCVLEGPIGFFFFLRVTFLQKALLPPKKKKTQTEKKSIGKNKKNMKENMSETKWGKLR